MKTLSVIEDTCNFIKERHGININIDRIPHDDPAVYKLLSNGETDGVFQVESPGMKQMLRDLKPRDFAAIVAAIALYRPGPMDFIPDYIAAYNGFKEPEYISEGFKEILSETYGIIVYQEQVMLIAQKFAGYTPGQADMLRKAMGKKIEKIMNKEMEKFVYGYDPSTDPDAKKGDKPIPGLLAKGMDKETAIKLADVIKQFAKYAFNKSHSAGYAVVCYQTAWLKVHYPNEFMAALLTSICDDKEKVMKYITEAKRMGMTILPPDVNSSEYGFINEGENGIRYGLGSISGVGFTNVENLISYRPYTSIKDLIERAEKKAINKKVLTALTLSGALDSLVVNVTEDLIDKYIETTDSNKPTIRHRLDLLQYIYKLRGDKDELDVDNFTPQDELQCEVDYLGMYLSRHPLDGIAEPIDWDNLWHDSVFDCIAIIRDFRAIKTKRGDDMAFIDIECLEGHKDLVLFPKVYNKLKSKIKKDNTLIFTIRKKYNGNEDSFIIENIKSMKKTSKGES